uniref:Rubicon Homology domain-containing protein n=1 Tax=Trypanosoma congolense (strain IL3000) TaxID=1068625 RepID=G0UVU6_TRYCI|nr:conserved hypothetical protein [Trypanosoma congolense IL3000]
MHSENSDWRKLLAIFCAAGGISGHSRCDNDKRNAGRSRTGTHGTEEDNKVAVLLYRAKKVLETVQPTAIPISEKFFELRGRCFRLLLFLEWLHCFVKQQRVSLRLLKITIHTPLSDEVLIESHPEPTHHTMCFSTALYVEPPDLWAKDAAARRQGGYCKQCITKFHKKAFPLSLWKEVHFCHYTGWYYCSQCHSDRCAVIPAWVLHKWDFKPRSVCNDAYEFLKSHYRRPVYSLATVNPTLYDHTALLRMLRVLRLQMMRFRSLAMKCSVLCRLLYLRDGPFELNKDVNDHPCDPIIGDGGVAQSLVVGSALDGSFATDFYVPRARRYLLENSETWSTADLVDVRRGEVLFQQDNVGLVMPMANNTLTSQLAAYSKGISAFFGECDTVAYLKQKRAHILQHIFVHGCGVCRRNSIDVCRVCCPREIVRKFECDKVEEENQNHLQQDETPVSDGSSSLVDDSDSRVGCGESSVSSFLVHVYDVLHVHLCSKCGASYHRCCVEEAERSADCTTGCLRCR